MHLFRLFLPLALLAVTWIPSSSGGPSDGCSFADGDRSCTFTCPGEYNMDRVAVTNGWNAFSAVEGHLYCGGALAATCGGHGDCQAEGASVGGPGTCSGSTTYDGGFSGGCQSEQCDIEGFLLQRTPPQGSSPDDPVQDLRDMLLSVKPCNGNGTAAAFVMTTDGQMAGQVCHEGSCTPVAPVCIVGRGRACGIGLDAAQLAQLYPRTLFGTGP